MNSSWFYIFISGVTNMSSFYDLIVAGNFARIRSPIPVHPELCLTFFDDELCLTLNAINNFVMEILV
jgi:hypothetical protein